MPNLIPCVQKNDALLAEIHAADVSHGLAVWWLGQSGFLVKSAGGVVLFDPYLSDSLTKKYADTDKPHVRMSELVVDPARLDMVDVITSSHNHTDHLDAETLKPLLRANPGAKLVVPEANRGFVVDRLGLGEAEADHRLRTLRDGWDIGLFGEQGTLAGITAAHNGVERDERHHPKFMGYVAVFPASGGGVYHSGDTLMHDGLVEQLVGFNLDLAILPINGHRPERRVAGNLFGDEAARLAKRIGAKLAVPCHYDMFEFNTEPTELFVRTCEEIGQPYKVLRCGERLDIESE